MKNIYLFTLLVLFKSAYCFAQERKPIFIGIQPSITQEKFYEKDEFDINIVPIVAEFPISKGVELRFSSLINYHIGGEKEGISDIGFQALAPIFFRKKEHTNEKPYGFYMAPVGGYGRNILNDHHTCLLAIEPGYLFKTSKKFTLSLGVQFGGSYFDYDEGQAGWQQHFGIKLNLGFWL